MAAGAVWCSTRADIPRGHGHMQARAGLESVADGQLQAERVSGAAMQQMAQRNPVRSGVLSRFSGQFWGRFPVRPSSQPVNGVTACRFTEIKLVTGAAELVA